MLDKEGDWGWEAVKSKVFWGKIKNCIKHYEGMTWTNYIGEYNNHPIAMSKVSDKAKHRLNKIDKMQFGELYQMRVGKKERVWGVKQGEVFYVLWWDPEHTVYPYMG